MLELEVDLSTLIHCPLTNQGMNFIKKIEKLKIQLIIYIVLKFVDYQNLSHYLVFQFTVIITYFLLTIIKYK